jgi:hypothetical protein
MAAESIWSKNLLLWALQTAFNKINRLGDGTKLAIGIDWS